MSDKFLSVTTLVSGKSFEPLVAMSVGNEAWQMSVDEAREHAMQVLEAAEAAQSDAFVFDLIKTILGDGVPEDEQDRINAGVFEAFTKFRAARKKKNWGTELIRGNRQ